MSSSKNNARMAPQSPKRNKRSIPKTFLGPAGEEFDESTEYQLKKIQEEIEKKHFNRLENMQTIVDELRDSYIRYNESARRCKIKLDEGAKNDQIHKFYYKPKVPFMKKPETQDKWRREYIEEVTKLPEPEPLYLLGDSLHLRALDAVGDRKSPELTKRTLTQFYQQRFTLMQHKKYRLLNRWAHTQVDSKSIDNNAVTFQRVLASLQDETDSVVRRIDRLSLDDKFAEASTCERPSPTISEEQHQAAKLAHQASLKRALGDLQAADMQNSEPSVLQDARNEKAKLYIQSGADKAIGSAIRLEDVEVFLRVSTYQNKIKRYGNKLVQQIKWIPYGERFRLWADSRELIKKYKEENVQGLYNLEWKVSNTVKDLLESLHDVTDEKGVCWATDRYTYHLQGKAIDKRIDKMQQHHVFDVVAPFCVAASDIELKHYLEPLTVAYEEHQLGMNQLDIDQGQQFHYKLQTFFPAQYEKQVAAMSFDLEDTGYDPDVQYVDRLTKNLEMDRYQMLDELQSYANIQRKVGVLGCLKNEKHAQSSEDQEQNKRVQALSEKEFSKQAMIRRLRTIAFFTLDEIPQKLRKADWLEYICFEPNVSDSVVRQNSFLSSINNDIDSVLKGSFNFIDIHDSATVNKIIESSANDHIKKIQDVQESINDGSFQKGKSSEFGDAVNTQADLGVGHRDFTQMKKNKLDATQAKAAHASSISTKAKLTEDIVRESVYPGEAHRKKDLSDGDAARVRRLKEIPDVNPLNINTIKAFYSLRLIKTRDTKVKLLSVLNYFRAIQRIITFDLKEFHTRERSLGEFSELDQIKPYFGHNKQQDYEFAKRAGMPVPGSIFQNHVDRDLDENDHCDYDENKEYRKAQEGSADDSAETQKPKKSDPVTLKAYKLRDRYSPLVTSTCPLVPKYHRTFGKQTLFESVKEELDRKKDESEDPQKSFKKQSISLAEKKDRIFVSEEMQRIEVLNEFGIPIMYEESLGDMVSLEEEMLKVGSYYINQYEFRQVASGNFTMRSVFTRPSYIIDRPQIVQDLFEKELEFQFQKVLLIEVLLEGYEHICDPLESVRVMQMIVDIMSVRPRLNTDASMYTESYLSEIEIMKLKTKFFKQFIALQKSIETDENSSIQQFQEMKCRSMQEFLNGDWVFEAGWDEKLVKPGSAEDTVENKKMAALLARLNRNAEEAEREKQQALDAIGKRHITEFANEQYTNFSTILGLPNVTLAELNEKEPKREPIIIDALREAAHFEKQREGYPWAFCKQQLPGRTAGLHTKDIGLSDFYDSMTCIPTVNAALVQGFHEISNLVRPENGFAESCLEQKFLESAIIRLKMIHIHWEEKTNVPDLLSNEPDSQQLQMRGANKIEEDFYFGNTDKLSFMMREFQAEMHPENLESRSNPLVVAQLDATSVQNFNFPRLKNSDVVASLEGRSEDGVKDYLPENLFPWDTPEKFKNLTDDKKDEAILHRMIDLAKNSIARKFFKMKINSNVSMDDQFEQEQSGADTVKFPSMLTMACNIMESHRLREELIESIHETSVLSKIYVKQTKEAGKAAKLKTGEQFLPAITITEMLEFVNLVDSNDGLKIDFDLAFTEFDKTLSRNLDFKSESCIKSLMMDLGVEELRAVLHLQIMQQQLLQVGITVNSLVLDGPNRALAELKLFEAGICVPDTVLKLEHLFYADLDQTTLTRSKGIEEKIRQGMSKSHLADNMFQIGPKKRRYATKLQKILATLNQRLNSKVQLSQKAGLIKLTPEAKLRVLRSMRLKLCHKFCHEVLRETYAESLKIQTMQVCNELRLRAQLFPSDVDLFHIGLSVSPENTEDLGCGELMENLSFDGVYRTGLKHFDITDGKKRRSVKAVLTQQFNKQGILYIPTTIEICGLDRSYFDDKLQFESAQNDPVQEAAKLDLWTIESDLKRLTRLPTRTVPCYQAEGKQKYAIRKINFKEAHAYPLDIFKLLQYYTLNLNIFNLEYIIGRNTIPAGQILEMEQRVFSGCPFWTEITQAEKVLDVEFELPQQDNCDSDDNSLDEEVRERHLFNMPIAERVIRIVLKKKKGWINLAYDMKQVASRMRNINKLVEYIPADFISFTYLLDVLTMQHHNSFFQLVHGLETVADHYLKNGNDDYFSKTNEALSTATKRQTTTVMYANNAFYITQASTAPSNIPLTTQSPEEVFANFEQQQLPVVDEAALVPKRVTAVQRMYGYYSKLDRLNSGVFFNAHQRNYQNLRNVLLNFDDEQRQYIGNNLLLTDPELEDYLMYKGLLEMPSGGDSDRDGEKHATVSSDKAAGIETINLGLKRAVLTRLGKQYEVDLLSAKVEYLTHKIETGHLTRVFMSWLNRGVPLPKTTKEYNEILQAFHDSTMFRCLAERDILNDIYWTASSSNKRAVRQKEQLDMIKKEGKKTDAALTEHDKRLILDNVNTRSSEFQFFNRVNLIRAQSDMIRHLLEVQLIKIGINMINNEHAAILSAFDQAATETEIQQYVHPNQQFASTLFQDVDKIPHLNVLTKIGFAQSFLTRLRNRGTEVETLTSKAIVFTMKDFNECLQIFCKSLLKYGETELRTRSETHAVRENQYRHLIYVKEMESIYYKRKCEQFLKNIDAIISAKMSQKGNKMIYETDMVSRELRVLKDNYYLMEDAMREQVRLEYQRRITTQEKQLKRARENNSEYAQNLGKHLDHFFAREIESRGEQFKKEYTKYKRAPVAFFNDPPFKHKDPDGQLEILGLLQHIKKYKTFHVMKSILTQERHDKEIRFMQDQMTQNEVIWDQLAESEKREQITRQELEVARRDLNGYEKLIDKLHGQLEHLNAQKTRLLQYKNSKSKRIGELEAKMAEVEILEAIDLNKILDEMRMRGRQVESLTKNQKDIDSKIGGIYHNNDQKLAMMERKYQKEHEAKMEAFEKLEAMRLEIKNMEGKDMKNDLWKDKCREMYDMCQELEKENDSIKSNLYGTSQRLDAAMKEIDRLNAQNANTHLRHDTTAMSKHISQREQLILHRNSIVKPQTAGRVRSSMDRHALSKYKLGTGGQNRNSANLANEWTSLNSQTSFPGMPPRETYQGGGTLSGRVAVAGGGFRSTALSHPASAVFKKQPGAAEKHLTLAGNKMAGLAGTRYGVVDNVQAKSGAAISDSLGPAYSGADRDGPTGLSGSHQHTHIIKNQPNDGRTTGFQINPKRLTTAQGRQNNYTAGMPNMNSSVGTTFGGDSELGQQHQLKVMQLNVSGAGGGKTQINLNTKNKPRSGGFNSSADISDTKTM